MLFKDLKSGYPVYLLQRGDNLKVSTGKITAVAPSRFQQSGNSQMSMVTDITIDNEGVSRTYEIPDSLSVTYTRDGLVISTDKDGLIREVEAIKTSNEEELLKVDVRKKIVEDCDNILSELNPQIKEKRENEERITNIESSVTDLKGSVKSLESIITSFIKEFKG